MTNTTKEKDEPGGDKLRSQNVYKTLIISNIAEAYHLTYKRAGGQTAAGSVERDLLEAERAVLYGNGSKVVVTSFPIDKEYISDLKLILGYENFLNLFPTKPSSRLCLNIIKEKLLFKQIEKIIRANPGINIVPYYATEEFFDLLALLRQQNLKFYTPETISQKNRFIRDHYNCKVGFRKLWEKSIDENSFVKIPQGFIVDDLSEAIEAAWWFYQKKINFVVKYNRGISGLGIVFYQCKDLPKEEKAFKKYLRSHHQERIWFEENFVVEEFIDVDDNFYGGSPSIEFKINSDLKHTYNCFQRLGQNATFEGIIISQKLEEQSDIDFERVVANCQDFGQALDELGYKGIFDVDLVIDKKHNVYAVESNLRRTGGTHIYETSQYLFGKNFLRKTVVASNDFLPVTSAIKKYSDFKKRAKKYYFSKEKKEGIIPSITSYLSMGIIGYIVFGKTLERLKQIENQLAQTVS